MKTRSLRVIISGGGSGGHIFPAVSIANALKKNDQNIEILFIGAKGKMEMEKVPKAGYTIEGLWISGFHRKKMWRNILFPVKLIASLFKAERLIRKFKPDVVVGVGGFASGPTLEVATRKGIPTLIQEQNSYPGITNRLLAKKVSKICVAYPSMEKYFPKDKIQLIGNPVRASLLEMKSSRKEAFEHFGFNEAHKAVFMIGGSLGAWSFNMLMKKQTDFFEQNKEIQILWQCGKIYEEAYSSCKTAALENVKVTAFIDRMDLAYEMADVIIARAGAGTIAELSIIGKPVILVPSPNVAEDHQTYNAKAFVDVDAAILVADKDIEKDLLLRTKSLLENKEEQKKLSENIKKLAITDAAKKIAKEVMNLANIKKSN